MARAEGGPDARVDAWLRGQPKEQRDVCSAAGETLWAALPEARETITWGFPTWVGQGNIVAAWRVDQVGT